jgi:hypothetical protein
MHTHCVQARSIPVPIGTHTWLRGTQHLGHCRVAMLESAKKTGKKNSGMYLYWAGLRTQTVDRPAVCFGWVATQQKPKPISQSSSVGRVGDLDAFTRKSLCGLLIYTSIVPVLTLRLYFWDVHENNQTTIFFHSLSLTQLYMTMYIIRKTLMHNKT